MANIEVSVPEAASSTTLSDAKRELLKRRLQRKRAGSALDDIPVRPAGATTMSFGQERIWFQSQIVNGSALFNIAFLAHIDGPLDVGALTSSLNEIVSRHEVLRAGFVSRDGAPEQFFLPPSPIDMAQADLSDMAATALDELQKRAQTEARKPFDLAAPPLLRVALFKLAASRYALLFVVHHIIWDGWSSGVFISEITNLYQAKRAGQDGSLPPLVTQYADFAHWHRAIMASNVGEQQIEYWRRQLEGLPELISLPTDRPRLARQNYEGATYEGKIVGATFQRISAFARRHNVTQFSVLLAAYNVLVMHYSGHRDIAIGTAVACRSRPMLENLLGFFANVLPLRTALDDDPSFDALVKRTHQNSIEAQSNQDVPFDILVDRLTPQRALSHNPLFQVAFVQHHLPIEELRISDLRINFENLNTGAATFDLVMHIYNEAPGLKAVFEYDSHLFDARTVQSMASCFNTLLDQLLSAPDLPVSQARLLDIREEAITAARSTSVLGLNHAGPLLHDMIDEADPDAIAVVCDADQLTYSTLTERANKLAQYLRSKGVDPDTPVALLLEPSPDMIVAILAILKADGAYLPLEATYPPERVRDILQDSGAKALISTSKYGDCFLDVGVEVVLLDTPPDELQSQPSVAPTSRAREANLAYIIYTSGSTGLSKGVMISHRSAVDSTRARAHFYGDKVSAFLLLSSVAFDSSIAGIFWTLSQGATLCIATEDERRDPGRLARIVGSRHISHLLCLPSLHDALLDFVETESLSTLRCCIVAGEACRPDLAKKHFAKLQNALLYNEYGPTECAVWSTACRVKAENFERPIPIGLPIPGAQTIILGVRGAMQPSGAAGEIWIGGFGLARGYVGRPDLTADRFRPNPFGEPGERLYRTADGARWSADGEVEFLGRLDEQLKIRGFRVDPAEIEFVISRCPEVRECVVVANASESGATRLVAYYTVSDDAIEGVDLARRTAAHLPSFMRPDQFIQLDAIPRLPNGKINRNALPEPTEPGLAKSESQLASVTELLIGDIWRDVLGISNIHGNDNFFELGGKSLAAMQVVARIRRTFGREIPVGLLFEASNLRTFSEALDSEFGPEFEDELATLLSCVETEAVD